jgi:hypothetical protein
LGLTLNSPGASDILCCVFPQVPFATVVNHSLPGWEI